MEPFKWIWQYISRYKHRIIFVLILSFIAAALGLINPYITGRIVGEVFQGGLMDKLPHLLLIMICATLLKQIIRYTFLVVIENTSQQVLLNLRKDIYKRVQEQNFSFFDTNRVGDIMSRMTGDLEAVRHMVAHVIIASFENLVTFLIAVAIMFTISWEMTISMLIIAPIIAVCTYRQSKEIKPSFIKVREQFSKLNSVCQENISGNRVVKAFTKEDFEIEKFTKQNQEYCDSNINSANIWVKYFPILEFLANLFYFILLLLGGILTVYGKLQLWQLVAFNGYLWAINNPMRIIGWLVNDIQRFVASLEKIHGMMTVRVYIKDPENAVVVERIKGKVEFKDVSFGYDRNDDKTIVLKNISFVANPGETIGIVGATGSGKTTLINLLSRYYDAKKGEILVDDINVNKYQLNSLRKDIAAAMQDVFLFSDTVEGNIAYGKSEAPMSEIIHAAKVADANSFILKMEEGYDTIVGERGVGLSGGQKQRLSLARAIATNPSILILDDTTSAVDMETEHEIQMALTAEYSDRTKFIIAHRISSVKHASQILVLDNGQIIERGTHDELLSLKGYYYSLFMHQYGDFQSLKEGAING